MGYKILDMGTLFSRISVLSGSDLSILGQISKALLVQKHPLAMAFTERLYDAFDDASISWEAAKAIGEIPTADSILTKGNHAEVKVCYFGIELLSSMVNSF